MALAIQLADIARARPTPAQPIRCCQAQLIDESRLLKPNLPGADARAMLLVLEHEARSSFNFEQLLLPGVPRNAVTWTVDGSPLTFAALSYGSVPELDHVSIYTVRVARKDGSGSDAFRVIITPPATRELYQRWLEKERGDLEWLNLLPPVYASLLPGFADPEPSHCPKDYWGSVQKLHSHLHPGGAYEMRSRAVGDGSGHQAVYDAQGNLIRTGLGAGSADRATPRFSGLGFLKHRDRDVRPFVWAAQLDGNPVNPLWLFRDLDAALVYLRPHLQDYMKVRPALVGTHGEVPAGSCINR